MKPSPLEFARDFEKLKSELSRLPAADLQLLLLARFWERLAPVAGESAYKSYLNDYCSLVIGLVQPDALSDLTIDSLNRVRRLLNDLVDVSGTEAAPELRTAISTVTLRLATLFFYVGAIDEGLALCLELKGGDDLALPTETEIRGLSPLDTLRTIYDKYRRDYPELGTLLQGVLAKWEEDALAVEHDRVWCLFVDKDGKGNAATGRMRLLRGTVEQVGQVAHHSSRVAHHSWWGVQSHPKGRATNDTEGVQSHPKGRATNDTEAAGKRPGSVDSPDQVAFDNQVKTPDDPFIGVAYDSLKAARTGLRSAGFAQRAQGSYRAFLSIDGSNRTFTGDSIGLAVSLVAFTQLLKPEVMRQERFIASDIAVTGSIDAEGRITPVNNDTIAAKIERAFFSHVRYVVLPEANLATARDTVKRLKKRYPRRKLRLVSAAHLDDVLNDRNIIRSEKVCLGAFITKKAARYTRATKVQVPLLLMLLYALTCLIYPKAWIGFDWNPARAVVNVESNSLEVFNARDHCLWADTISCNIADTTLKLVLDLDGDGSNEVLWMPQSTEDCSQRGYLTCYESDGSKRFRGFCGIMGKYRKDTVGVIYTPTWLNIATVGDETVIVTQVTQQIPARTHIRFWSSAGDSIGWYINWGHMGRALVTDLDDDGQDELVFLGFNNSLLSTALLVLRPDSCYGFSPPYFDTPDLRGLPAGNQYGYVLFPVTDLGKIDAPTFYNRPGPGWMKVDEAGLITVNINEGGEAGVVCMDYSLDSRMRVVKAIANDAFNKRRSTLADSGCVAQLSQPEYQEQYLDAVTYWIDSGWVTEGELSAAEAVGLDQSN